MTSDPLFLVAANIAAASVLRMVRPNLCTAVILAVVLIASTGFLGKEYGSDVLSGLYGMQDRALTLAGDPPSWPPLKHRSFPDLELVDQDGELTKLSEFRGKVILIETVGSSCAASVALAGGASHGPFQGVSPQSDLEPLRVYAREYGRFSLDDPGLVHVHLILFNRDMKAPTSQQAHAWARHFDMQRSRRQIVLAGTPKLANSKSREMVPGFLLVDTMFRLRADSTGHPPQDDLYTDLLPLAAELLAERETTGTKDRP